MYEYTLKLSEDRTPYLVKGKRLRGRNKCNMPDLIYSMIQNNFDVVHLPEEHVYLLSLDTKCHINGVFEISHGSVDGSFANPREILIRALMSGASSIVMIHNHPSGDPTPSEADILGTQKLNTACKYIGISLLDHVITGTETYYSMLEHGTLVES